MEMQASTASFIFCFQKDFVSTLRKHSARKKPKLQKQASLAQQPHEIELRIKLYSY
jgi:hypothetical protein